MSEILGTIAPALIVIVPLWLLGIFLIAGRGKTTTVPPPLPPMTKDDRI